jgi:type II secretory pathway pseudopilin PulG
MSIVLLGITAVSLLLALVMSVVAWRLAREERARRAARVAALSAAASETDTAIPERVAMGETRSSAPWAAARVSIFGATPRPSPPTLRSEAADVMRPLGDGFLGGAVSTPSGSNRQRGLAVAAVILFAVALGGGYWTMFGDRMSAQTVASAGDSGSPLELVSLRHERKGKRLAVTGLVRNPSAGTEVDTLTAVVFLFDQQGGFITSARANVDFLKLAPGDESPFEIELDAPVNVARYRVSFRNDAGIVSHVDRRGQPPIAASPAP